MSINSFFILASESKSRILILKNLGLNFKKKQHNINEKLYKKIFIKLKYSPKKISLQLAKNKAKNIKTNNTLIIGSDTVINFKGKTIEKAKMYYKDCFADECICIFDDANFPNVVIGAMKGLEQIDHELIFHKKVLNTIENPTQWWNGIYVTVIKK